MKVAVIGYDNVGMATFNTLLHMPEIHELVLCGRNKERIEGELSDFKDSLAINTSIMTRISGGGYEMTKGADIIIYTAGPSVKSADDDRMSIVKENEALMASAENIRRNSEGLFETKFIDRVKKRLESIRH